MSENPTGDQLPVRASVYLKVKSQDGNEMFFKIKRTTKMKKLMKVYCNRRHLEIDDVAFVFNGRQIRADHTADELEMEDWDQIDAKVYKMEGLWGIAASLLKLRII